MQPSCSAAPATVWAIASAWLAAAAASCAEAPVRVADTLMASAVAAIAVVRSPICCSAEFVAVSMVCAMPTSAARFSASDSIALGLLLRGKLLLP